MRRKNARGGAREEAEEASVNLTPLIDVVFVVLIMFIIIAPMLEVDKIQLAGASQRDDKEMVVVQESSPITLRVHADNTIDFNSKPVALKDLLPLLVEAKKKNPNKTPQLYHDKKAHFGTYQSVKNALESAGFEQLDVILQPG
jgi:biopolymer transport protein ExbD